MSHTPGTLEPGDRKRKGRVNGCDDETPEQRAHRHRGLTEAMKDHRAAMVAADNRRILMAELLLAGHSIQECASILSISTSLAKKHAMQVRKLWRDRAAMVVEDQVAAQNARLERILQALWERTIGGECQAVDRVLRLLAQQADLLGLNAAIKLEAQVDHGADAATLERKLAALIEAAGSDSEESDSDREE